MSFLRDGTGQENVHLEINQEHVEGGSKGSFEEDKKKRPKLYLSQVREELRQRGITGNAHEKPGKALSGSAQEI